MKSKLTFFALIYLLFNNMTLSAYDHGNAMPTMASRQGGQIVSSDTVNAHFEMVNTRKLLKLYVYPMDLKLFDSKNFGFKAICEKNGSKGQAPAVVVFKDGFYEIQFAHRKGFKIYLNVTNKLTQKEDLLRFVF